MFYLVKYLYRMMAHIIEEHKDPRVLHLPLVGSPLGMSAVIIGYLLLVLHYGPKWMEKREPYNLKYIMRLYNAVQVLSNLILLLIGLPNSYLRKEYSFTCQPVDTTNTEPWMHRLIMVSYGYYLTKYLDLFDTIFFVLRKRNKQITFLHVYHHAGMVFAVYVFMTFLAGSHSTMIGIINLGVHTVMYSYYFLSSLKTIEQTLWWKRYITQMQMTQFGYLFIHFGIVLLNNTCQHPMFITLVGFIQSLFMFALFFDFYYRAYVRKPQAAQVKGSRSKTASSENLTAMRNGKAIKSS